jgi:hypothetical protein
MPPLSLAGLQQLVGLGLLGVGLYFGVKLTRDGSRYLRYRRVAPTALLTWPAPASARQSWLFGLGVLAAAVAGANALARRPAIHVAALALVAAYFLGLVPLVRSIRFGLYGDGIWAYRGLLPWPQVEFLPWRQVARIAFIEAPEIELLLTARHKVVALKLPVPAAEYGAVRKILEEKTRAGQLRLDPAILGI